MKRDIYKQLHEWKKSLRRKPLIVNGARQVGKTYALRYFGKEYYDQVVYLNFERDNDLYDFFQNSLNPKEIIKVLSIHTSINIEPSNTLIIFDEVQECPRALNSLKYFYEEANDYHVVAAGSLLGIKTASESNFPVGKVNFLNLYPLNFFEYLTATGNEKLRLYLEEIQSFNSLPLPMHDKLIKLLKYYFYVGGMPEVVNEYIKHNQIDIVREVQQEILDAYEKDFAKHAPNQVMKIITTWKQVHRQLSKENKKFIFSNIRKSARGRDYEEAIQWLLDAGLIYKSYHISKPNIPLAVYANTHIFKLFLHDVGLLSAQSNLSAKAIIDGDRLFTEFKGALTENFVAQELIASGSKELYYWTSEGKAEIDFIIEKNEHIYPLEVKSSCSKKKKSLSVYRQKYQQPFLCRSTLMNLKYDGQIYNYPLYLISRFPIDLTS